MREEARTQARASVRVRGATLVGSMKVSHSGLFAWPGRKRTRSADKQHQ